MTLILGNFISSFYENFGTEIAWYGIFLYIFNFIVSLLALRIGIVTKSPVKIMCTSFFLIVTIPFNILTPTYTVTSIFGSAIGLIGIFIFSRFSGNVRDFVLAIFVVLVSFLIRPEGFTGTLLILLPIFLIMILNSRKQLNLKYLAISTGLLTTLVVILNQIQVKMYENLIKSSLTVAEYLNFQTIRHEIFYTPAILKLHQSVISGDALTGLWSNIDFILLRNWAYADSNIFSYEVFKSGRNFVADSIGLAAFANSDFQETMAIILNSSKDVFPLILLVVTFIALGLYVHGYSYLNIGIITSILFSYLIIFYYAAAALRLPFRVSFPYFALIILMTIFFTNPERTKLIKSNYFKFLIFLITIQIISLQSNQFMGIFGINAENKNRIEFSKQRDQEIMQKIEGGIFIGPLAYLPQSNQGAYLRNLEWNSGHATLALDWSTFSPTWRSTVEKLGLDSNNVYDSLATQDNVYWISNSYLAEILNMYMNDRQIFRGKLCSVAKLTGNDQAEIFTFQAKETDC
jgi:hypothetical protein